MHIHGPVVGAEAARPAGAARDTAVNAPTSSGHCQLRNGPLSRSTAEQHRHSSLKLVNQGDFLELSSAC